MLMPSLLLALLLLQLRGRSLREALLSSYLTHTHTPAMYTCYRYLTHTAASEVQVLLYAPAIYTSYRKYS
jgi:hypothetical protein